MRRCLPIRVVLLVVCLPWPARAENWAQFRGPNGSGLAAEKTLPTEWGADKNLAWKVKLPGVAWSQPVVWGDKDFCLGQNGVTVVLAAGPQFKVLATNKLDDMFWSSTAVVGGRLLLRGVDHLYCIAK